MVRLTLLPIVALTLGFGSNALYGQTAPSAPSNAIAPYAALGATAFATFIRSILRPCPSNRYADVRPWGKLTPPMPDGNHIP